MTPCEITVDGIPLGEGYGIELEREEDPLADRYVVPVSLGHPTRYRYWLTQCGLYCFQRVRQIPPDAVIVMKYPHTTIVYDQRNFY